MLIICVILYELHRFSGECFGEYIGTCGTDGAGSRLVPQVFQYSIHNPCVPGELIATRSILPTRGVGGSRNIAPKLRVVVPVDDELLLYAKHGRQLLDQ